MDVNLSESGEFNCLAPDFAASSANSLPLMSYVQAPNEYEV
jgi:hypothetical protein